MVFRQLISKPLQPRFGLRKQRKNHRQRALRFEQLEDRLVLTAPTFSMAFLPATIGPGSVSTLQYTITNNDPTPVSDLAFMNMLPTGVVIAAAPQATSQVGGIITAAAGGDTITFADGSIAASTSRVITVDVTSSTPGANTNGSVTLNSSAGSSMSNSADLTVATNRPGFTMAFADATVALGQRTTLTYTINNNANESGVTDVIFSNNLPTGLVVAGPANITSNNFINSDFFPVNVTATPGSSVITVSVDGLSFLRVVAGNTSATISVDVIATGPGTLGNTTGVLVVDNAVAPQLSAGKASASINVVRNDLHMVASFTNDPVAPGGTVNAQFTITNFDRNLAATGISFDLNLGAGLSGLMPSGELPANPLGAGSSLSFSMGVLSLTGGSLAAEGSGTFNVALLVPGGAMPGAYVFPVGTIDGTIDGSPVSSNFVVDSLFVTAAPTLAADFLPNPVGAGDTTTLRFTLTNTSSTSEATDIAFSADLAQFISGVMPSLPATFTGFATDPDVTVFNDILGVSGGSLAAGATGTISVALDIPGKVPAGTYTLTTSNVMAMVDGMAAIGAPAAEDLEVVGAPSLRILFTDDPVLPGGTATLEFTVSHDENASAAATGITFTVDLNAALPGLASISGTQNDVVGTGSSISGTSVLTLTGGTLAPGETATFSVTVQVPAGATPGKFPVTTSDINATVAGLAVIGSPAADNLDIVVLTLNHTFAGPVVPGQTTTLTYTLENLGDKNATGISFTHNLGDPPPPPSDDPVLSGLTATSLPDSPIPGLGGSSSISGTTKLTFSGGELLAGQSASFNVEVMIPAGADPGVYGSKIESFIFTYDGSGVVGAPATSTLTVVDAVSVLKTFTPGNVAPGDLAVIEYTITNNLPNQSLSSIAFTDDLNSVITGLAATDTPVNQNRFTVTGTTTLSVSGSLAAGATATFQVTVQVPEMATAGTFTSTTSSITGNVDMSAVPFTVDGASADLTVTANPDFGDAPISYGTRLAEDGARHLPGGPRLGDLRDFEADAQGPLNGTGDDVNGVDDEDGVTFVQALVPGRTITVNVVSSVAGAKLNFFFDWDQNGTFGNNVNEVYSATLSNVGLNQVTVAVPLSAVLGNTYARFRISTAGGLGPTGSAPDGEVEDYAVAVENFVVTNTNDSGLGSLRRAIEIANDLPGRDTISFNIPGGGSHTILVGSTTNSALPTITERVVIDGITQPGYSGTPLIVIDGSMAGAGVSGLQIVSGASIVRALAINNFSGSGIELRNGGGNSITRSFLGVGADGASDQGNNASGVLVVNSAANTIGGTAAAARNVISGNQLQGVLLVGAGSTGNLVYGNFIGTNAAGTSGLGNGMSGVQISGGASGNTIGGAATGARNVISGNGAFGVYVANAGATGNVILGNRIGTNAAGTSKLGNTQGGVKIASAAANTVGGVATGAGNLISGNLGAGVIVSRAGADDNLILGNFIGTDVTGASGLGNAGPGLLIATGATNNASGGTADGAENVIADNQSYGVSFIGAGTTGNIVQGNLIGTSANGANGLGNRLAGVRISANAAGNTIGGSASGAGNVISGNHGEGVLITNAGATANVIQGNRIGTTADGGTALGNGLAGVRVTNAHNNTVGGDILGAGNVISGNMASGVLISGASSGNVVQGNLIGVNAAGSGGLGNGTSGVVLASGANHNTIGGNATASGNVISANGAHGLFLLGATTNGNLIRANRIGTDLTNALKLGNSRAGIRIEGAAQNTIGGTMGGQRNLIFNNVRNGIEVVGASATGNAILRNAFSGNGLLGIDLATDGVTPNDVDDPDAGPNNLQNFPVLASAVRNGATLEIQYSVPSTDPNSSYDLTVQFFLADASGQQGNTFLGQDTYLLAEANTTKLVTIAAGNAAVGRRIVSTATDANGNTSEFSANVTVTAMLQAAGGPAPSSNLVAPLNLADLHPIVDAALLRFAAAGASAQQLAALSSVQFAIADLRGATLGLAGDHTITLDINAAGYGWYIDPTPLDDSEFTSGPSSNPQSAIDNRQSLDLLTAVMHELGHELGLKHADASRNLMNGELPVGVRRLPTADLDAVFGNSVLLEETLW